MRGPSSTGTTLVRFPHLLSPNQASRCRRCVLPAPPTCWSPAPAMRRRQRAWPHAALQHQPQRSSNARPQPAAGRHEGRMCGAKPRRWTHQVTSSPVSGLREQGALGGRLGSAGRGCWCKLHTHSFGFAISNITRAPSAATARALAPLRCVRALARSHVPPLPPDTHTQACMSTHVITHRHCHGYRSLLSRAHTTARRAPPSLLAPHREGSARQLQGV